MTRWKREYMERTDGMPIVFVPRKWQDWSAAFAATQVANYVVNQTTPPMNLIQAALR